MMTEPVTLAQIVDALRPRRVRLAALWEAVTEECRYEQNGVHLPACAECDYDDCDCECPTCRTKRGLSAEWGCCRLTGRVPRDVSTYPDGAVAGMLGKQAMKLLMGASTALVEGDAAAWIAYKRWLTVGTVARTFNDPAALAATLAAVSGTPVDTEAEAR